ncbi:MAG: GspH/FimT family pseudopilin [Verrucomicrobia bacterium]|nr:GspH/FimT family pseudopilin [Verrucomicrobiota bacterium]MDE3099544.1 GspH/FimT family pseudopilin [Verrucomicrobiota bacterium]
MTLAIGQRIKPAKGWKRGFTLIELILVMGLLVIITSLAAPAMSRFIRGRALDSEARRMAALIHAGRSRAVSEGMPMMLWLDEKRGAYGLEEETPPKNGDRDAETLAVDESLEMAAVNAAGTAAITFQHLPAIRFLPDGTVDENSPRAIRLSDSRGHALWLVESDNRMGYDIEDTDKPE